MVLDKTKQPQTSNAHRTNRQNIQNNRSQPKMVEAEDERICAKNCWKYTKCKKIPVDIWNKKFSERIEIYKQLAKECSDYECT